MVFGGFEKFTLIDYPGKVACMVYTIGCNFRCPYCHNPELVDETVEVRYGEEEILAFLDRRKGMIDGIVITGGEPTMHDDLLDFMKKVKDRGFLVKLDSNGTRPAMIREAIDRKLVDYIAMDMKAPLSRYSQTVARPVDTEAIAESIALLMSSPVEYEFRTTVIKSLVSPEEIEEIGREIKGAKRYYLQKFIPTKLLNPQFRRKTTYTDEEFEGFRKTLSAYVAYCGIR
ncbi:MAG: anaerobic ribonucleoside-triphosphate reductase activating protein [Candidatus Paceibacterota bacterium]|jgi:pyruvate formate lyase activating enzyme